MALHAYINIFRESGYTHDPVERHLIQPNYDQDVTYDLALSAATGTVAIPFGPIATATLAYLETDAPVTVTPKNGGGSMTIGSTFFVIGSAMTGLDVVAATGANLKIYLAGV